MDGVLYHHGVKGMKWGVRHPRLYSAQMGVQKRLDKLAYSRQARINAYGAQLQGYKHPGLHMRKQVKRLKARIGHGIYGAAANASRDHLTKKYGKAAANDLAKSKAAGNKFVRENSNVDYAKFVTNRNRVEAAAAISAFLFAPISVIAPAVAVAERAGGYAYSKAKKRTYLYD